MNPYLKLAQQTVIEYFNNKERLKTPTDLPEEMLNKKGGVFVTLYNQDKLRGCIGTFLPTEDNLAEEIISNALSASTKDNRFSPITKEELPELKYEVSILSEPELIKGLEELDVKRYGIIVKAGYKTGLLLPDLKGVETVTEQIAIASQKAGINPANEKIEIYKFTTTKYE